MVSSQERDLHPHTPLGRSVHGHCGAMLSALLLVLMLMIAVGASTASSHHNGAFLPLVPQTPLMQSIIKTGAYTWCVNETAAAYPSFINQLRDVQDEYTARVGIKHQQVEWGPGCQVQHNFISGLQCGGCAAHIFYANNPVIIEYKADLAFVDWRTTSGHELGHGLLGLHEQYQDSGSIQCLTDRIWTVMSCGTGVRYPQTFDVTNGCSVLATVWCGSPPPPPLEEWDDASCTDYDGPGSWIRACYNNWRQVWAGMKVVYYEFKSGQWECVAECQP